MSVRQGLLWKSLLKAEYKNRKEVFAMRIMSFNLLCYGREPHIRETREDKVVKIIKETNPDSFGVQEATPEWMDALTAKLDDYAFVGVGREDGKREGEFSAVFYKKEKFTVSESGTFWLSETPDVPSMGWDARCFRVCTWAKLCEKATGKIFVHINTHLDHVGVTARVEGVKMIKAKAASFGGTPVVCTGDFNVQQDTDCYVEMVSGNMGDARKLAPDSDTCYTFHAFEPEKTKGIIDFVFVDKATVKPLNFKVINKKVDGEFYSDHNAIYADVEF